MLLLRGVSQTIVKAARSASATRRFRKLCRHRTVHPVEQLPLLPYPVLIFLVVIAVAAYVLHFTVFGRYVYAIGGNRDAAEYSGIPVKRVET